MSRILFFPANAEVLELARNTLSVDHSDILLEFKTVHRAVDTARNYLPKGLEIVIARGSTATLLREEFPQLSTVEILITSEDISDAFQKAKQFGNKIAIVAYPYMMKAIKPLMPFFKHQVLLVETNNETEVRTAVKNVFEQGADVVVGGGVLSMVATARNLPHVMVGTGKESLLQAAEQAKAIRQAHLLNKLQMGEFDTIMDYISEGIITVDRNLAITGFNPMAAKLTGIQADKALGQTATSVLPQLSFKNVIDQGQEDLQRILVLNGSRVHCNLIPIVINNRAMGIVVTIQKASRIQQMEAQIRKEIYSKGHVAKYSFAAILGKSSAIMQRISVAKNYAQTQSNVLIIGQSGTGKELFAQSIHNASSRAKEPFVAINCAALPPNILESELFGYVGGAFTGANREGKPGLFEIGHTGTVFLDEIAELSLENQGRLLRVIQEKNIMRLGSDRVIPIDVRIISATNKDLNQMISEGRFRDDLYYRLNVLRLLLPPLRERLEDIEIYACHYLDIFSRRLGKTLKLSRSALHWLKLYEWPGNVRELENLMERIAAICPAQLINAAFLENIGRDNFHYQASDEDQKEYKAIMSALKQSDGNIAGAAGILGLHRSTLWRKLRKYGL